MKTEFKTEDLVVKRINDLCQKSKQIKDKKMTPYMVSKNGNFNPRTLNNILSGTIKDPRISTIKKICDGLNISLNDFFNDNMFN